MPTFLLFWILAWAVSPVFSQVIPSTVYAWPDSSVGFQEQTLLEGTTRDFSHFVVQAITVSASQSGQPIQQFDEEAILVIKAGTSTLTLGGKRKLLGPNSTVMIMPGDEFQLENRATQPLSYYLIRYTSNQMPDLDLYHLMGNSFWVDWQAVSSTADHQRNSRQVFACATVMSSRISMQAIPVAPGLQTPPPHAHRAAEILIILDYPVQAHIDGAIKNAQAGDIIFVESDLVHYVEPSRQEGSTYLSIQF